MEVPVVDHGGDAGEGTTFTKFCRATEGIADGEGEEGSGDLGRYGGESEDLGGEVFRLHLVYGWLVLGVVSGFSTPTVSLFSVGSIVSGEDFNMPLGYPHNPGTA